MPCVRSFCKSLLRTWSSSLPLKLKTVKGNARFYVGGVVQCLLALFFVLLLYQGLVSNSTTTYMSLDYTKYQVLRNPRTITNCSQIPLTISTDVTIDETGNWSTSTNYKKLNTMKEISFVSYSGDISVFNKEINDLNSCIDEVNAICSENLFPNCLLYLAYKTCRSSTGKLKLTFPLNFAYVFDYRISYVKSMIYNEHLSILEVAQNSSFVGTLTQSGSLLTLSGLCNGGFGPYPRDICGYGYDFITYVNLMSGYDVFDIDNPEGVSFEMQLNLDSIVRCVAVNIGIYNASFTDDLLVLETGSYGNPTLYKAVYVDTDGPNVMYLDTSNNTCYILFEDAVQGMFLQPSMQFVDPTCNVPCDSPERSLCESEKKLSIWMTIYSIIDYSTYGAISLEAFGAQGYINDYFYYANDGTGTLSCNPFLNLLPLGNQTDLPFTLVEGYFKCTQRVFTSWMTVLASAYSNSQLIAEFLILFSIALVLKIRKRSVSFQYDDGEVEIATIELAVERIKEKREMGLATDDFHSIQHSEGWKAKPAEMRRATDDFHSIQHSEGWEAKPAEYH